MGLRSFIKERLQPAIKRIRYGQRSRDQHHQNLEPQEKPEVNFSNIKSRETTTLISKEQKEQHISQATDWKSLYEAIRDIGEFETSQGTNVRAYQMQERISAIFYSNDPLGGAIQIPRSYGLRKKYKEIYGKWFEERPQFDKKEDYIRYYRSENMKIKDPERYLSQSVESALSKTKDIAYSIARSEGRNHPIKMDIIKAVSMAVYNTMEYDYEGFKKGGDIEADKFNDLTNIIVKAHKGVCRHQAPLLVAVLKRLGFDAHQVWHEGENNGERTAHTLAYIADADINSFVNPDVSDQSTWSVIPFDNYDQVYGGKTDKWRARSSNNTWYKLKRSDHRSILSIIPIFKRLSQQAA
jgi:hypothetical protein